jgi:predicted NACHT family NTPase
MFVTLAEGIQFIKKQVLGNKSSTQDLYIPIQATYHGMPTETPFDLQQEIMQFFHPNKQQEVRNQDEKAVSVSSIPKVLLLQGDAGSGKSVFCQDLIAYLWQSYHEGDPIPLFVALPQCEAPTEHAIEETLSNYGFTE